MRAQDIIRSKRDGGTLSKGEIAFMIDGALGGTIPPYQMSAFLMAVYFRGMESEEIAHLTAALIESGRRLSFSGRAPYVDKHSTGGVGDGTSLVIAPLLAACGVCVPMISGRALGHTGGTLDKLDSIPSYSTTLTMERFAEIVEEQGYAMCGQTEELTPADKYLYALRDVTATVESIPLIVSSILSKKIAEGSESIVIDVKYGHGAFARDIAFARALARQLIATGARLGAKVSALITDMNQPLGVMIGNFLEVEQAAVVLGGYESAIYRAEHLRDYWEVARELSIRALLDAGVAPARAAAEKLIESARESGAAWRYFCANVTAQGGDITALKRMFGSRRARYRREVCAATRGYISGLNAYTFGVAAALLGVGRVTVDSPIDAEAGIELRKKEGDHIEAGEAIAILYSNTESSLHEAEALLVASGITIAERREGERSNIVLEVMTD